MGGGDLDADIMSPMVQLIIMKNISKRSILYRLCDVNGIGPRQESMACAAQGIWNSVHLSLYMLTNYTAKSNERQCKIYTIYIKTFTNFDRWCQMQLTL